MLVQKKEGRRAISPREVSYSTKSPSNYDLVLDVSEFKVRNLFLHQTYDYVLYLHEIKDRNLRPHEMKLIGFRLQIITVNLT